MKTANLISGQQLPLRESFQTSHRSLICIKSIAGGVLVAMVTYLGLIFLGTWVTASRASTVIQQETSGSALMTTAALWIGFSAFLALGLGSYFAARTSNFVTARIGAAQGLIISSLFFGILFFGATQAIGVASQGLGNLINASGMTRFDSTSSLVIQNAVENTLGSLPLNTERSVVVTGLLSRLAQSDSDATRNYLSYQTTLLEPEVAATLTKLENDYRSAVKTTLIKTTDGISRSAASLFWIMLFGIAMAAVGGAAGAVINFREPLAEETFAPSLINPGLVI